MDSCRPWIFACGKDPSCSKFRTNKPCAANAAHGLFHFTAFRSKLRALGNKKAPQLSLQGFFWFFVTAEGFEPSTA